MKVNTLFVSGCLFVTISAVGLRTSNAVSIAVQNASFEDPFVTDNSGLFQQVTPTNWSSTFGDFQYVERQDNGGFTGQPGITGANNQYIANDGSGVLSQDLGVPFFPNTLYVVNVAGGHRNGFTGSNMQFGLQSASNPGTDLVGATIGFINENALTPPTFDFASALGVNGGVFSFTTGNSVPPGNLLAFLRSGGNRMHADSFSVEATPVPEPSTIALLGIGVIGLMATRRRRNAK